MRLNILLLSLILVPVCAAGGQATPASAPAPVKVAIYPLLVQAPIYGATMNVPSVPGGGGGSEGGTASTDVSVNSLYMGGAEVYAGRVFGEFDIFHTKPSASHDITPRIDVSSDIWAVSLKGGYRLYKGLGVTGGARRVSTGIDTTMEFPQSGVTLNGSVDRANWSPFVGVDWRGELSRKWTVDLSADVGGMGVDGSQQRLRARADWRPIPHVAIRGGFQVLRLELGATATLGGVQRTWSTVQTMYGPEIGFGIVF